jgi:hypothetical protein
MSDAPGSEPTAERKPKKQERRQGARDGDAGPAVDKLPKAQRRKAREEAKQREGASEEEGQARALQWLTEQLPPGTERQLTELLAEAGKLGLAPRDIQRARRRMNPPSRKIKTDQGVVLRVGSDHVDESTPHSAKREGRKAMAAVSEEAAAAAAQWLQEQLPPGTTRRITELVEDATTNGLTEEAVRRAASQLGFRRQNDEDGRKAWTAPHATSGVRSDANG